MTTLQFRTALIGDLDALRTVMDAAIVNDILDHLVSCRQVQRHPGHGPHQFA